MGKSLEERQGVPEVACHNSPSSSLAVLLAILLARGTFLLLLLSPEPFGNQLRRSVPWSSKSRIGSQSKMCEACGHLRLQFYTPMVTKVVGCDPLGKLEMGESPLRT